MYNPFSSNNIYEAERYTDGSWFFELFNSDQTATKIKTEKKRLEAVLCNPAILKVFKLQCDMFSLGYIEAIRNKKPQPNDKLLNFLKQPNFYQSQRQYLWDYMFWTMLGTSYLYTSSKVINDNTVQYWLDSSRFEWTDELIEKLDKIVLSKQTKRDLERLTIRYYNLDGTWTKYQLSEITPFFDLSNGLGNWYRGNSVVDALYKIISNSDGSLDAKSINLEFSRKFFITGQHKETDVMSTPMAEDEKKSIEKSVRKQKPVHAIKSMVDLKRFVDDMAKLALDEAYFSDYYKIANMYGIPRDVAEASLQGSTFENQEKSKASWIEQSLAPKGEDLMDGLQKIFGYNEKNIDLHISWNHLSFMQVFERDRASVKASKLSNLRMAQEMGILTPEEVIAQGKEIFDYEG